MTKTGQQIIVGGLFVGLLAAGTFLLTRKAAAKAKAKEAFTVDGNCGGILVLDEEKAKSALLAAAIAVAPTPDSSAIATLRQILAFMFPQCVWEPVPPDRTFIHGAQSLKWSDIEALVGDRTVAELRELLESSGLQAATPQSWFVANVFGTGGCLACALGTGGAPGTVVSKRRFKQLTRNNALGCYSEGGYWCCQIGDSIICYAHGFTGL